MRKLLLILLLISLETINAQLLPLLSKEETPLKSNSKGLNFYNLSNKGNEYFKNIETTKKGSGYKPFKRWEYHWKHYLQINGEIAPPEHLWKAWEQKNKLATFSKAISNWVPIGPYDQSSKSGQGRINTVAVHPNNQNIIYAGAPAGGLWKSEDGGVNWTPLTDHLPQIGVSGIAIDANNTDILYIATGDDDAGDSYSYGVWKSEDGGLTWHTTGPILGNPTSTNEIIIDPSNSQKIWVATSNGLFLSTNGGDTWGQKLSGHIKDLKIKPTDSNTIYAVSSNRFYKSTNGGLSFSTITSGLPSAGSLGTLRIEVTPANQNNVYLVAGKPASQNWAFEGFYVSTNSGSSFTKTAQSNNIFESSQAWFDLALTVSPTDANTIFVGVLNIWKSTNGGTSFSKINDWRNVNSKYTHADIHFLRFFHGNLYAGTDGGIYKSADLGSSFTDLTENMAISQLYKIAVSKLNSSKVAGGLQDNGGFSLINNTWHNYHGGDGMDAAADPNNEDTFYGFTQFGNALTVTNNGGLNSTFVTNSPIKGNWVTPLVASKSSDLYAGFNQLYRIGENSWDQISNHNFGGNLESLEIDPNNNNNIYASRGLNLYISNDKGVTFSTRTAFQTGLSGVNISSIEVHNTNSAIIWVTTTGINNIFGPSSGHTGGGVYKSVDGGQTFTDISLGLPNESKFVVRHHPFSTDNSIYVGTALGVYHRNDNTNVWEVFSTNLPNVAIADLEINPYDNIITAATYGRSVWQSVIPSISLPQNDVDLLKVTVSNINCGTISPKILIANNGQDPINNLQIEYNVDGIHNETASWSGVLNTNETAEIELPNITSILEGEHIINAEVFINNDANTLNNQSIKRFIVNQSGEAQYINTFGDINQDIWLTSNNLWETGELFSGSKFNTVSGHVYATNKDGNYPDGTRAYLISPCYNLASLVDPFLKFKMAFDIEKDWDVLYMEYSVDNGENWDVLGTANDPNWYNSNYKNTNRPLTIGKQWTGTDTTFKEYSYDLTELNGEPNVIFRFVFASDQGVNMEGVVIDDFQIDASQVLNVNELTSSSFSIYPNPSKGIIKISRTDYLSSKMELQVYDITGKILKELKNIKSSTYDLDLSSLSKGMYFIRIKVDDKFLSKKIIVN